LVIPWGTIHEPGSVMVRLPTAPFAEIFTSRSVKTTSVGPPATLNRVHLRRLGIEGCQNYPGAV
jgi:hypothetical protein